jgi:hypothetical protein
MGIFFMKLYTAVLAASALATCGVAAPALADSLSPSTFSGSVALGGSITLSKLLTVDAGIASTKADVLFLSDTTGSMSPGISTAQSNFTAIANALPSGTGFAVAEFKDQQNGGDPFNYKLDQNITHNVATAQGAINSWSASGGGDDPEEGLYGLAQAATTTNWDAGAKRIIVMVGDAPEHEDLTTVKQAAAALTSNNVTVESIDIHSLTGDTGLNAYGQFQGSGSIYANGVQGNFFTSADSAALVAAINSGLTSAFSTYKDVSLNVVGLPSGATVTLPSDYTGSFDRSASKTFSFDPTINFAGVAAGTYTFKTNALLDGSIVATETDTITVGSGGGIVSGAVPEPASWAMMLIGFGGLGGTLRARRNKELLASA